MKRFLPTLLLAGLLVCGASACGGPSFAAPLSRPTAAGGTVPLQSGPANAAAGKPMKVLADGGPIGECIYSATSDESYVMYFEIDKSQPDIDARKQQLE